MENVPDLVGKKFIKDFHKWENRLAQFGYVNHIKILNSKDFGIPQNRKRVFMVSILNDNYEFASPIHLKYRLLDFLEPVVDEKYFLSDKMIKGMMHTQFSSYKLENKIINPNTIIARFEGAPQCIRVKEATKKGYCEAYVGDGVYIDRPHQKRGVCQKGMIQTIKTSGNDLGVVVKDNSLWTETQAKMITEDGNVKRYIDSEVIDEFKEGQVADISFPNGYNKGPRVHDECPAINGTTTASSFITKVSAAAQRKRENGQEIELSDREYANCITTIQKDSLVAYSYKTLKKIKDNICEFDGCCHTITANCMKHFAHDNCNLVVVKDTVGNEIPLYKDNKQLIETINNNKFEYGKPLNLDLYNRTTSENSQTLTDGIHNSNEYFDGLRIRKLTPKECFRLMGFEDSDYDSVRNAGLSDSAIYHCAGDSIVTTVLVSIFSRMVSDDKDYGHKVIKQYVEKLIKNNINL